MSLAAINYLNCALMIISAALAFVVPFEVLVFSYAFLGPAHYLTQLSWLHDRNYFSPGKWDGVVLIAVTLISIILVAVEVVGNEAVWLPLLVSLCVILTPSWKARTVLFLASAATLLYVALGSSMSLALSILLPTVIHVFFFTAAFVLLGSLKSKSLSGYLSVVVFALCSMSFFVASEWVSANALTHYGVQGYSYFESIRVAIAGLFGIDPASTSFRALAAFIGFAYLYHYLNWFSKTSVINWHHISAQRLAGIVLLYGASVALYLYDFTIGFTALLLLSYAHVVLEFPLDFKTVAGIGRELYKRARPV